MYLLDFPYKYKNYPNTSYIVQMLAELSFAYTKEGGGGGGGVGLCKVVKIISWGGGKINTFH